MIEKAIEIAEKVVGKLRNWKDDTIPDITPLYKATIEHHREVAVHAVKGTFPKELLKSKAPNQTPEEWEYQRGIYEQYTRSQWGRAMNRTKIIGNKQNYSIKINDPEQERFFFEDYPAYHSLPSFFFDIVREAKINFPNQLMVIEPAEIPGSYNENGEFIPDQSVMVEPIVYIIAEKDIIAYKENQYSLILTGYDANKNPIFKYFDRSGIYVLTRIKDKYEARLIYKHNWGYVPCRKLGGKPIYLKDGVLYESYFAEAIPELNGVIRLSSNLDMSTLANCFPLRIERVDNCSYRTDSGEFCRGGQIWQNDKYVNCPSCHGTGKASRYSPTGVKEVQPPDTVGGETIGINDIVTFVSPPTEAIEAMREQIKAKEEKAFAFIFKTSDKVQNTAYGAELEKDEFHSFILQFSNELFDLMEFAIEGIGFMRYMNDFAGFSISRPTSFNFRTSSDITAEIKMAKDGGLPSAYTQELLFQSTETRFNSNDEAEENIKLAIDLDPLWGISALELRTFVNISVTVEEVIIHQQITSFIQMAKFQHENFMELDRGAQYDIIYGYAQEKALALRPPQPLTTEQILNQI